MQTPNNHNNPKPAKPSAARPSAPNTKSEVIQPALPNQDDHCLRCNYPLRNRQNWRCPECGHLNSRKELRENQIYTRTALKFALRCLFYPLSGFLTLAFFLVLFLFFDERGGSGIIGFMIICLMVIIPLSLIQFGANIYGAARLTQAQVMRCRSPEAIIAKPLKATLVFLLHLTWLTAIPFIILFFLFYQFVKMTADV